MNSKVLQCEYEMIKMTFYLLIAIALHLLYARVGAARLLAIDSDIGTDFDDSWALGVVAKLSSRFDLRLFLTATIDTVARAQLAAKYLSLWNRTDVDIGIGVRTGSGHCPLCAWAKDFRLASYTGTVHKDGVEALHNLVAHAISKQV